jgi:hypothetical protein
MLPVHTLSESGDGNAETTSSQGRREVGGQPQTRRGLKENNPRVVR